MVYMGLVIIIRNKNLVGHVNVKIAMGLSVFYHIFLYEASLIPTSFHVELPKIPEFKGMVSCELFVIFIT